MRYGPAHPGYIYAVRILRSGHIKIGHTKSPYYRLPNLRGAYKSEIEVIGVMIASYEQEKQIHRLLKPHLAGVHPNPKETYHPAAEVLAFIAQSMVSLEAAGLKLQMTTRPYQPRPADRHIIKETGVRNLCRDIRCLRRGGNAERVGEITEKLIARLQERSAYGYDNAELLAVIDRLLGPDWQPHLAARQEVAA